MLTRLSVDLKGQVCVWGVIASHLLVIHLFSLNILCHKGLYQVSEHPPHAGGSLAFSLHVLNPDLLTLTLAQDVSESAYAPVFRFSHLIWAADPPTGWGQADGARGLMKGGWPLNTFLQTCFALFSCVWSLSWRYSCSDGLLYGWCNVKCTLKPGEGRAGVKPQTCVCLRSLSLPGREKCVLLWFKCFSLSGV